MKVVLCTDGVYPHAMGGMQRHSRLLAEQLSNAPGIELIVIHPHAGQVFPSGSNLREISIQDIDREKLYFRELWRYSGRVLEVLEQTKADVVLSQGFCVWKGIDKVGSRVVVMPHGLEMFQGLTWKDRLFTWPFRSALRWIIRRSAAVISLGGKLTTMLTAIASGSACRVVVVPNATVIPEDPLASTADPAAKELRLLFVGRFAFNKGLDVLLEAARRLEKEGRTGEVRFQLAGDGPLLEQMRSGGLPGNVELLGRVNDDRLARLYHECDALVLPTRFEGMPTVVLEAMARAKPIIVSDVGASAELVDMHNGYLLPPGDPVALHAAIRSFMERPREVHRKMGSVSLERVKTRFTWKVVTGEFLELLAAFRPAPPMKGDR